MTQPSKPPLDLVALRRLAAETWEVSVRMSVHHLSEAETASEGDIDLADAHLRFANIYARLAHACHKVPGSQF
jgi:hypothetical protein